MMGVLIAILFAVAIILLLLSFRRTRQSHSQMEQNLEQMTLSFGREVNDLQDRIREVELDSVITAHQSNAWDLDSEDRIVLREMLDMNKRGYSYESISRKIKKFSPEQVEDLLSPYDKKKKEERSFVTQ
ncbi:hypothetical protein [Priestia koreensis]|uniref:hypothetical protein n=2 Tax=Priestia koreensis TaxID=284581 RepID=UPI00203C9B5D|nr:hypothetical protein [Priestia koreensis]MCM3003524.1 hypothetical protein [Priestia koreensis]